ncbi:MFS transporter [Brevibacterium moorei]|uniref:MFS transporter n=1 Tax=Brevibacterium moorei TaxID=2968457 RepID=UPI00211CBE94|nr:MFS transporter [Brevibacterium sp. 68QC2CO]MCQ9385036.1 MFS transporter [Brevibacterium sp. 68QC2CO]
MATAISTDDALRKRTLKKVTWRLVPFLGLLYFINYLDRTNIGFAGPGGMSEDLKLSATAFGIASGVFFIGYLLLEVPSNMALHKFGARRWIARILVSWGIIAALMSFVPSAGWLYTARFVLGIAEAGFFPGIILYLTYWFPKRERAKATALFMLAIPLSTALGSPVSGLIMAHGHEAFFGLAGWRFMFLLEGVPAIILGIICWWFLTDRPREAKWLAADERAWLQRQMDDEEALTASEYHVPAWKSLASGRVWALALVYFGIVYGLYAISFFLPSIISDFKDRFNTDFSIVEVGLINAIPFTCGALVMWFWARHGDKTGERVWHVAIPTLISAVAIPITTFMNSPFTTMVLVSIFAMGVMCGLATFWPLPTAFLSGAGAAAGVALVNSIGNTAGFFAPYITGFVKTTTGSSNGGMWVIGAAMLMAAIIVIALGALPKKKNGLDVPQG